MDISAVIENQMEDEMETFIIQGFVGSCKILRDPEYLMQ